MIGKPYQVGGVWYTPRDEPGYDRVGRASWYGELFHGRRTANGEIYDMDRLSAAQSHVAAAGLCAGDQSHQRADDRRPRQRSWTLRQ